MTKLSLAGFCTATAAAALLAFAVVPTHAQVPSGYTLSWSDEFNGAVGSSPNSSNWNIDTGTGSDGWGNWELQTYTSSKNNLEIVSDSTATDGLALKITATDSSGVIDSGMIDSLNKQSTTYGYIETRARNPIGTGFWPAFWMLGTNIGSVGWPECGEQDIMELFAGNDGTNMGSWHMEYDGEPITWTATYTLAGGATFNQAYHTFGMLWTSTAVTDDVDGVEYETHPSSSPGWIFNHPFYYILNLAVGGDAGAGTPTSSEYPQSLYVDYVRLYEPSSGGGGTSYNGTWKLSPDSASSLSLYSPSATSGTDTEVDSTASSWVTSDSGVTPSTDYNLALSGYALCLDASGTTSGSKVEVYTCNGSTAQSWAITADSSPSGYYQLSPDNATTLDLDATGTTSGSAVEVVTANSSTAQQWKGL